MYATCRRRRCFLLCEAWFSHSAYDATNARMVKIVVAIVLESVEDDMSLADPSVPNSISVLLSNAVAEHQKPKPMGLCTMYSIIRVLFSHDLSSINISISVKNNEPLCLPTFGFSVYATYLSLVLNTITQLVCIAGVRLTTRVKFSQRPYDHTGPCHS